MTETLTAPNGLEAKALELLSSGVEAEHVASALGVTAGRISQIQANPVFAERLAALKFEALKKHNDTDNAYDALEKKILKKLDSTIDLVFDPMKLGNLMSRVNAAKRRGASAPDSLVRSRPTVRLNINAAVVAKFAVNGANQVVQASVGDTTESLVTIQSSGVRQLLNEHAKNIPQLPDETNSGEINGHRWIKPQGREKVDLLTECGFTHEIESSSNEASTDN